MKPSLVEKTMKTEIRREHAATRCIFIVLCIVYITLIYTCLTAPFRSHLLKTLYAEQVAADTYPQEKAHGNADEQSKQDSNAIYRHNEVHRQMVRENYVVETGEGPIPVTRFRFLLRKVTEGTTEPAKEETATATHISMGESSTKSPKTVEEEKSFSSVIPQQIERVSASMAGMIKRYFGFDRPAKANDGNDGQAEVEKTVATEQTRGEVERRKDPSADAPAISRLAVRRKRQDRGTDLGVFPPEFIPIAYKPKTDNKAVFEGPADLRHLRVIPGLPIMESIPTGPLPVYAEDLKPSELAPNRHLRPRVFMIV